MTRAFGIGTAAVTLVLALVACTGETASRRADGVDSEMLSQSLLSDYAVFAQRCSKCHSLARPLQSGIDDDEFWARYVTRMRRMPGSGITVSDEAPILRFLHAYSDSRRKRAKQAPQAPTPMPTPTPTPIDAGNAGDAGDAGAP